MKWHRIRTILLHSYFHFTRSKETWMDLVWFTFIQFILFGFLTKMLAGNSPAIAGTLIIGLLFWETVRIGQYSMSISILWEIWSKSLSSMFITPLTLTEMLIGQAIAGLLKVAFLIGGLIVLAQVFFHTPIFQLGPVLLIYFALLLIFSASAGLFVNAIIFRFGTDIQSLAWGLIYIFQPFSAVYYPVEALPVQIRWISYISPITYVMESARSQLSTGQIRWSYLGISLLLNIAYLVLSTRYIFASFYWSKKTGSFARLGN